MTDQDASITLTGDTLTGKTGDADMDARNKCCWTFMTPSFWVGSVVVMAAFAGLVLSIGMQQTTCWTVGVVAASCGWMQPHQWQYFSYAMWALAGAAFIIGASTSWCEPSRQPIGGMPKGDAVTYAPMMQMFGTFVLVQSVITWSSFGITNSSSEDALVIPWYTMFTYSAAGYTLVLYTSMLWWFNERYPARSG